MYDKPIYELSIYLTRFSDVNHTIVRTVNSFLEEFEDTTAVIRIGKSKNRQHNGQKENVQDKQRYTKHTYQAKDRITRTPLKTGGDLGCSGRVSSSCCTSGIRRVNLVTNPMISHESSTPHNVSGDRH